MPATTTRRNYTVTPDTDRQIADLAAWWGGVAELPAAQVIREAVRRAWEAESKARSRAKRISKVPLTPPCPSPPRGALP